MLTRCAWAAATNPLYLAYHDEEWGVPVHDDRKLFEMLILEGMQAGLSWSTILNKRANFRQAFANFEVATHGRRMEAAQRLGIGRNTITRKIQELGLDHKNMNENGL